MGGSACGLPCRFLRCPPEPLPQATAAHSTDHRMASGCALGHSCANSLKTGVASGQSPSHCHAPGHTHSGCLQDYTTIYSTMKRIADAEPRDLDAWTISLTLGEPALCLKMGLRGSSRGLFA